MSTKCPGEAGVGQKPHCENMLSGVAGRGNHCGVLSFIFKLFTALLGYN